MTLLSSDNYLDGMLVMARSLKQARAGYPLLVLTSPGLSDATRHTLTAFGLATRDLPGRFTLPEDIMDKIDVPRWRGTFDKLEAFNLVDFEKVVFIDADMMISRNIDHLFEREHMSCANYYGGVAPYDHFTFPNSGLLVIQPEPGLADAIFSVWRKVAETTDSFSDQNLLHHYYGNMFRDRRGSWRLPVTYNCCSFLADRIARKHGLNGHFMSPDNNTVAVMHFSSHNKPWEMTFLFRTYFLTRKLLARKSIEVRAYWRYWTLLGCIRKERSQLIDLVG